MYLTAQTSRDRSEVYVWERRNGERIRKSYPTPFYFYTQDASGSFKDIFNNPLKRMDYNTFDEFKRAKEMYGSGRKLYESDINVEYKVLGQYYRDAEIPEYHITALDIEVDYDPTIGYSSIENPYAPINAISIYHFNSNRMIALIVVPEGSNWNERSLKKADPDLYKRADIILCKNEKDLLIRFLNEINDSDILTGWNSEFFDIPYIYQRLKSELGESRAALMSFYDASPPRFREVMKYGKEHKVLDIYGRISLDYMELFKKFYVTMLASYKLESVADEFLTLSKIEYEGSLATMYRDDFSKFVSYNIRDTEILRDLEVKFGYIKLAILSSHSVCGTPKLVLGTVKLVELAFINFCHNELDRRVPDSAEISEDSEDGKFAGALVLDPIVGLHEYVAAVDVVSLYPRTIMSINISPETLVGQFYSDYMAYEKMNGTDGKVKLTLVYENGMDETQTVDEWKQWLIEKQYSLSGFGTIYTQKFQGIIPKILSSWFDERKALKKEQSKYAKLADDKSLSDIERAAHKEKAEYYNRLQSIKKLLLNSTYGVLGNKFFKFFDIRLAESTTRSGRNVLMHMSKLAGQLIDGEYAWPSESVIYGDTDSCMFKTHADNREDAIRVAKYIHKKLNASFTNFTSNHMYTSGEFNGLINCELDIIADKAIFVKKKMYAMHLFYSEDKEVDKMKIMGLRLKKTDIPKHVRLKLTEFIEQFLKGKTWIEISRELVPYRTSLVNHNDVIHIGLPKGVNKVEFYTDNYNLNERTRLPGHVAASIFWNLCLQQYNDKNSPAITSGMKIKVLYLRKNFGRFKAIAVPADMVQTPDWFKEGFQRLVDREKQVDRLIDKTLKTIIGAINEIMPTEVYLRLYDLLGVG